MFMNLHNVPAGHDYFTVYVSVQEDAETCARDDCEAEEVDVIAPAGANWSDVVNKGTCVGDRDARPAKDYIFELYGMEAVTVGVVNQSQGYVTFDQWRDREDV